jgi:hypothetical protein
MKKIFLVFIIFCFSLLYSDSIGIRDLPDTYTAGNNINVYLFIYVENNPSGVIVSETLPSGWSIINSTPLYAKYKKDTNTYKWLYWNNSGGFDIIEIYYTVKVPENAEGSYQFSGKVSTSYEEINIEGDTIISDGIRKIMRLEGDLNFGKVEVGSSSTRILRIYNDGNTNLKISSINCPESFSSDTNNAEIMPLSYIDVNITFSPNQEKIYSGEIIINSDKTEGNDRMSVYGEGFTKTSIFQDFEFYNLSNNILNKDNIPVDELIQIKGVYKDGYENEGVESEWQIIDENKIIFERLINEGDISLCLIPKVLLKPDKNYTLSVRAKKKNNVLTEWKTINFRTISQQLSKDTDGNGVPDEQEPEDRSLWTDYYKNIEFNGNMIEIEVPANCKISYVEGINLNEKPPIGENVYGLFITKIEVPVGGEIELEYTFPDELPSNTKWYKYEETENKWVLYNNIRIEGKKIIVKIKDGGEGDFDNVINGIIFDPSGPIIIKGDLNFDDVVDISDVILCLRMAVELDLPNFLLADINKDNSIDILDVILILKKALNI